MSCRGVTQGSPCTLLSRVALANYKVHKESNRRALQKGIVTCMQALTTHIINHDCTLVLSSIDILSRKAHPSSHSRISNQRHTTPPTQQKGQPFSTSLLCSKPPYTPRMIYHAGALHKAHHALCSPELPLPTIKFTRKATEELSKKGIVTCMQALMHAHHHP